MLSEERKQEITRIVNTQGSATVAELVTRLSCSEATIRREITALARQGRIVKVFGGAVAADDGPVSRELSVGEKETINREEKQRIARYAASLISPGDYVYIDSGTTTGFLADCITQTDATYVTNAIVTARLLAKRGFHVILIGGEVKESTEAIVGAEAVLHLQKYQFSLGFFGTNGASIHGGYTTPDVREASVKSEAMRHTPMGRRFVLADHDKFGVTSNVTFGAFEGTVILTDREPAEHYRKKAEMVIVP